MKKKRKGPRFVMKRFMLPDLPSPKNSEELDELYRQELQKIYNEIFISDEEWESAIDYIIEKLGKEKLEKIKELMKDKEWRITHHLGLGVYIRNLLRMGGFRWSAFTLDENWDVLLEDAVAEVFGSDEEK